MPDHHIRLLQPTDHAALAALMEEMQAHYRVPCPARATILAGLAALPVGVSIFVGGKDGAVLAFASLCNFYPGPGLRSGLFLKEIYVSATARGAGLGRALMLAAAEFAVARGDGRIDWTADAEDPDLLRFYDSLGAVAHPKKLFYRLTGEALADLAKAAE